MQIKFDVFWNKDLGTFYKDNSIDTLGKEANVNIDLDKVLRIYVNFQVGEKSYTDNVEILDVENKLIRIPFKTDVIKQGLNKFELVAVMKDNSVLPSQTYTYRVDKSLENPNSVEADTNYPLLIELMDLAGNKLIDMDKSIQKVDISIENMTNEISSYKETTTNALNSDISSYKESTTKELESNFNNYSNNTTSNITRVLDSKIVEVDNVVSIKSNELDVKFTTKANEITKTLNSEINKINTTLTNKVNEVNRVLDNKVNEVDELIVEVENAEQLRQEELENITNQLSSYSSDLNTVKSNIKEHNTRLNALEKGVINDSKIDNLEAKVENHETRIKANENTLKHHDILLKSLNILDETISIENEESTVISLPQSKDGIITIDELQGNTLVNYCANGSEELTLNNEINVQGANVTLTDTIDNGKVDVVCEGNTLVNLVKNFTLGTHTAKNYALHYNVANSVHTVVLDIVLESTAYVGFFSDNAWASESKELSSSGVHILKFTPTKENALFRLNGVGKNVTVNKLLILEGDYTNKPIPSYFEGMKSAFELEDNKVEIVSSNLDNALSNTHSIQLSEPLRGLPNGVCDKFVKQGGKWYVERNCGEVIIEESWLDSYIWHSDNAKHYIYIFDGLPNQKFTSYILTDKIPYSTRYNGVSQFSVTSTSALIFCFTEDIETLEERKELVRPYLQNGGLKVVYELETPTYEEITDPQVITYLDTTHISNNSTIPCNMQIKNSGYNAIIKPSTQYTVALDTNKSGEVNIGLGGAKTSTTNNVATITTPSTLTDDSLTLYGKGIKASNVRLLEGDKTNYIPQYFEGMKSCFEDKEQDNGSYEVEIMSYNENKSNSIQLQLNEPLRAVGDMKDRFVLKDGKLMIERNCGIREYQEGDFELDNTLTDKTNTTYILNEPTYEEVPYETQKLILECFENGTLFFDTNIPPTVSVTYSANKPVVVKLNQVDNTTNVNTEDIAMTQIAVDFLLMSSLGEEMVNFKIKGGTNMSAYFASRIIKGALKYEDVISKYPNYKEDIDLILISEGYSDLIIEL